MWVYIASEPGLWTVGFYNPDNVFVPDSDHTLRESAAARVAWLNGGGQSVCATYTRSTERFTGPNCRA